MAAWAPDRRTFGAGLAAALAAAPAARAQMIEYGGDASRVPFQRQPATIDGYQPPTDLKSILDIYKRMTGPVRVDGAGPFPFVVDTGANQSVVSAEIAAKLGLTPGDPQPLNGVAGVQTTPTVTASLQFGNRAPHDVTLSVLPEAAIGGPGMLGLDQLDGARLTLDFARQQVTIDDGPALPGGGHAFHMRAKRRDGQLTLVDANLAGIPVTAFLDSGAQDTIGNMALRELAITRYPLTPIHQVPIISVTGQTIAAQFADLPSLRIGGVTLPSWPVAFADLHIFRMWDLTSAPAILIGVDVLSRFETVCLDFRHDEVGFRLPAGRA
ncbi:MAG TPA: aspartyl protease family protein [Caulobacteraceae bacterium]|nr:aspartyl protease family protein [Caulobacteraceae bacterium]